MPLQHKAIMLSNVVFCNIFTKKYFNLCIFRCLKFLGSRHPTLVLPLVPELLSTHPFFDTPEPDMDEPACIFLMKPADHFDCNRFYSYFPDAHVC